MGYWGYKIFQSDHAYDLIEEIIADGNGPRLYWFQNSEEEQKACDAFNAALLQRLISKYETDPEADKDHSGRDHKIILVIALAMETGASLSPDIRAKGKEIIQTLGIPRVAREQVRVALEMYRSGTTYQFDSPGLHHQIELNMSQERASDQASSSSGGNMQAINVFPNVSCCKGEVALSPQELLGMFAARAAHARKEAEKEKGEKEKKEPAVGLCIFCRKSENEMKTAGKHLMRCGKCKREDITYCSRECQKADWKKHKEICGKEESAGAGAYAVGVMT